MGGPAWAGTSLLRAGLFPLLRDRHFLPVHVRLDLEPGAAPLSRQLRQSVHDTIRADVPNGMLPWMRSLFGSTCIAPTLSNEARNYPLTPVIVLDQFEELLRSVSGSRARPEFKNDLGDLAENRIPRFSRAHPCRRGCSQTISFAVAKLPVIDQPAGRLSSRSRRMVPTNSRAGTLAGAPAPVAGRRCTGCGAQTGCTPDDRTAGAPVGRDHRWSGTSTAAAILQWPARSSVVMTAEVNPALLSLVLPRAQREAEATWAAALRRATDRGRRGRHFVELLSVVCGWPAGARRGFH